jgi:hypothetical protein
LDYFKTGKKKVDFLHFYGFGVCLPMYYWYVYLLGTQILAFRL